MTTSWPCEDEEEALGLELLLQRAKIPAEIVELGGKLVVQHGDEFAPQAEALVGRMARHFAKAVERDEVAKLDRSERLSQRALWAAVAVAIGLVALAWAL